MGLCILVMGLAGLVKDRSILYDIFVYRSQDEHITGGWGESGAALKRQFTVGCKLPDHVVSLTRRYNKMAIVYLFIYLYIYLSVYLSIKKP